jgi:hypothetical protein
MKKQSAEIPTRAKKSLDDLHQLFPERSLMLVSALRETNKEDKKLPEWRSEQIFKAGDYGHSVCNGPRTCVLVRAHIGFGMGNAKSS